MFDHLSDPNPPDFGDGFRRSVVSRARARRRRTRLTVGGVAAVPVLLVSGTAILLRDQANELERIEVVGLAPGESLPSIDSEPTGTTPLTTVVEEEVPPIASPLNVLVAGVDRRPPGSDVIGSRADTIAVVRVDPDQHRVSMLSLPRDLWISVGDGRGDRLNTFTDDGGLVEVVSSLLGIDINHYVEVDFDGFRSLIDIAGGVTVPFDTAVRDTRTRFTAEPGCNALSGAGALAYVRSRHLEALDPATGAWTPDSRADIGRIERQQDLMQRVYVTVLTQTYSSTDKVRLLTDVIDDITVDSGLDLRGLLAIFNAAARIGPDNFDTYDLTANLASETVDGNSVLVADPAGVQAEVDKLLGQTDQGADQSLDPNRQDAIDPGSVVC
jgi:LCP family protein required for cell wall assembly